MNKPCINTNCPNHSDRYFGKCGIFTVRKLTQCAGYVPAEDNAATRKLVVACLQEARQKHQLDPLHDEDLNEDYHIEVTLTVGEIKAAAKSLQIKEF